MAFANLEATDTAPMPGGQVEQRLELLRVSLNDGARVTVSRELTGCALVRIEAHGQRAIVSLPPELAVRVGSHLAALGAASLDPLEPEGAA